MSFEKALEDEIKRLKDRLAQLREIAGNVVKPKRGRPAGTGTTAKAKPKRAISPARRKQQREHGFYLGAVRNLTPAQRAAVKKVRAEKGVAAAIAAAKKMGAGKNDG